MNAEQWARWIPPRRFHREWERLDHYALRGAPQYRALAEEIGLDLYREATSIAQQRRRTLQNTNPEMHDALELSPRRFWLKILSVLGSAGTIAFYFTRSGIGPRWALPGAAIFLAVAALSGWAAALPLRPRTPPSFGTVFVAWTAAIAGVVAVGMPVALYGAARSDPLAAARSPWWWVAVGAATACLVLAVVQSVWRLRTPATVRAAMVDAVDREKDQREPALTQLLDRGVGRLSGAYALLPEDVRTRLEDELAAGAAALEERGLVRSGAAVSHRLPGLAIIDQGGRVAATVLGVRHRALVPDLHAAENL